MVSPHKITPKQHQRGGLACFTSGDVWRHLTPFISLRSLGPMACNYFHLLFTHAALFTRTEIRAETKTGQNKSDNGGLMKAGSRRGQPTEQIDNHQSGGMEPLQTGRAACRSGHAHLHLWSNRRRT